MQKKIKIILAEDHNLVRAGFKELLARNESFEVIGEATNGRELLDLLKNAPCDIVLMDIEMPIMNGYQTLPIIKTRFSDVKVIILSIHTDLSCVKHFLSIGASSYLSKTCLFEQLEKTILKVFEKGFFLEEKIAHSILADDKFLSKASFFKNKVVFSPRELQIFREVCEGKTEKEIASNMNISIATVHFHKGNIFKKTNTHSVSKLMIYSSKNEISL